MKENRKENRLSEFCNWIKENDENAYSELNLYTGPTTSDLMFAIGMTCGVALVASGIICTVKILDK